jgi:hypothetical protein
VADWQVFRSSWQVPDGNLGDTLKVPEEGDHLDERLKELMQELGNAINESLSDSDRIASAIGEIKRAGYDVFLVLEATIGFNKREDSDEERNGDESSKEIEAPMHFESAGKIRLTSQDQKFLRALKISIEEDQK